METTKQRFDIHYDMDVGESKETTYLFEVNQNELNMNNKNYEHTTILNTIK